MIWVGAVRKAGCDRSEEWLGELNYLCSLVGDKLLNSTQGFLTVYSRVWPSSQVVGLIKLE